LDANGVQPSFPDVRSVIVHWKNLQVQTVFFASAVAMDVAKLFCCIWPGAFDTKLKQARAIYDRFFFLAVSAGVVVLCGFVGGSLAVGAPWNEMMTAHLIVGQSQLSWSVDYTCHLLAGVFPLIELSLNQHHSANAICELALTLLFSLFFFIHELLCHAITGQSASLSQLHSRLLQVNGFIRTKIDTKSCGFGLCSFRVTA
jgi:hypothetical protein